jgi:hypothetical protein
MPKKRPQLDKAAGKRTRQTVSAADGYRTPMMPKGNGRKRVSPGDILKYAPPGAAGIAGLRRAAGGGALGRMRNSGIRDMNIRETDAYRRLEAYKKGKEGARMEAERRIVERTGVGRDPGYKKEVVRQEGKRLRTWSSGSFPQGEPSGKRPIRFTTEGSLKTANSAGKEALKNGVPRTTPPGGRPSGGGGVGRGGSRVDGLRGGGGGGEGGILGKKKGVR